MSFILFTGNSTLDGTGEIGRAMIFEAPDSGCPWPNIEIKPQGMNVANLVRLFSNNGGDPENPKNNRLFAEVAIPASGSNTKTTRIALYGVGWLFPGNRIFATIHHATAGGIEVEAKLKLRDSAVAADNPETRPSDEDLIALSDEVELTFNGGQNSYQEDADLSGLVVAFGREVLRRFKGNQ